MWDKENWGCDAESENKVNLVPLIAERVGDTSEPRGSKTQLVLEVIGKTLGTFSLADLERACPGVSRDMIRRVLSSQKGQTVDCIGRGPGALWQKR